MVRDGELPVSIFQFPPPVGGDSFIDGLFLKTDVPGGCQDSGFQSAVCTLVRAATAINSFPFLVQRSEWNGKPPPRVQ